MGCFLFAVFPHLEKFPNIWKNTKRQTCIDNKCNVWAYYIIRNFNIFGPIPSRPVDLDISKLDVYFLTNAIFISGILKEA